MKKLFFCLIILFSSNLFSQYVFVFEEGNGTRHITPSIGFGQNSDIATYSTGSRVLINYAVRMRDEINQTYPNPPQDANGMALFWSINRSGFLWENLPITFRGKISNNYIGNDLDLYVIDILYNGVSTIEEPGGITPFYWWDKNANGFIDTDEAYTRTSNFAPNCPNLFKTMSFDDVDANGAISPSEHPKMNPNNSVELLEKANIDCVTGEGEDINPDPYGLYFVGNMPLSHTFSEPEFILPEADNGRELTFMEVEGVQEFFDNFGIEDLEPNTQEDDWGFNVALGRFNVNFDGFNSMPSAITIRDIIRLFFQVIASIIFILATVKVLVTW